MNQNLHLNKVSRRLLCTLNFEKHCPKGPNQLLRTPKLWEYVFLPKVKEITDPVNRPMKVKVSQSCPALCNPMDYTVHGILQARILEWVADPFSRGSSQPRDRTQVSHIAGGFFTS